jgi:hypothetical protein
MLKKDCLRLLRTYLEVPSWAQFSAEEKNGEHFRGAQIGTNLIKTPGYMI